MQPSADKSQSKEYVAVAQIVRPQGRRGEVAAEILTDFPKRLKGRRHIYLGQENGTPDEMALEGAWEHKGRLVLKFAGVDSIDDAERLRGRVVLIPRGERAQLEEGRYYVSDLVGCRVVKERSGDSVAVGIVSSVEPTGGVDLLHVKREGLDELLIPLAQEICTRIDTDARLIVIDPPDDLLELNEDAGVRK